MRIHRLRYVGKLEHFMELKEIRPVDLMAALRVRKSYYYNVIKRGRCIPSGLIVKRLEEACGINFKAADFER